jgi:hypothetical protein
MADFANLVLGVDTSGLKRGERALNDTTRAGGRTEQAVKGTGRGFDKAGRSASTATPKVAAFGAATDRTRGMAVAATRALTGMVVGLGAVIAAGAGLSKFISATVEADASQAQLAATILSTGSAANKTIEQLNQHASALQGLTNFGDEATNAMQGLLLTFTQIQGGTFDRATVAVLDVATAMGTDLNAAALQVGKALNDPVLGMTALSRSGIQFTQAQKDVVKAMVATNDIAGAQNLILNELETQFGGSATAARDTLGGALTSLGNAFGDLFEISGEGSKALRDAIESLIVTISSPDFIAAIQGIGVALFGMAEALMKVLGFLSRLTTGIANTISVLSSGVGGLLGFSSATGQVALASEQAALAIAEEVKQADLLLGGLVEGREYSIDYIGVKLAQAQAHLAVADSARQENIEIAKGSAEYLRLQGIIDGARAARALFLQQSADGVANAEVFYGIANDTLQTTIASQEALLDGLQETTPEYKAIQAEIDYINRLLDDAVDGVFIFDGGLRNATVTASGLAAELAASAALMARMAALGPQQSSAGRGRGGDPRDFGGGFLGQGLQEADAYIDSLDDIAKAGKTASGAIDATAKALADQISALEDAADPLRVFNRGMAELDALKLEGLSDGAYAAAVEELREQLEQATPEVGKFTEMFKDGMGDAIDYTVNGFKDGFSGLLDIIKSTLLQAAQFAIANPIKLALGIGGTAGASGGLGGGIQGIIGEALGGFGSGGSILGMSGLGGGAGALGGLGNALSSGIGGLFNVGANAAAAGGGLMATLGAVAPMLGIAAAAFSFFKSKTTELDSGLRITADSTGALVEEFKKIEKSKFWGLSKKVTESLKPLEDAGPITDAIDAIKEQTMGLGSVLGLTADNFASFSAQIKVSLKGLSEQEANAAIVGAFNEIAEQFSYAALGAFQEQFGGIIREGDTAASALENMVTALNLVNPTFKLLGFNLFEASVQGAALARNMADTFGGFEQFSRITSVYYAKAFSDIERVGAATTSMSAAMSELGVIMPSTVEGFRNLVEQAERMGDMDRVANLLVLFEDFANIVDGQTAINAADAARATAVLNDHLKELATAASAADEALATANRNLDDSTSALSSAARDLKGALEREISGLRDALSDATDNLKASFEAARVAAMGTTEQDAENAGNALASATDGLRDSFAAEQEATRQKFQTIIDGLSADLTSAQDRLSLSRSIADALSGALNDRSLPTVEAQRQSMDESTAYLKSLAGMDRITDIDALGRALNAVSNPSEDSFSTRAEFDASFGINTGIISALEKTAGVALSADEQAVALLEQRIDAAQNQSDTQIQALKDQLNALLGIDESTLTIAEAQAVKDAATVADNNAKEALNLARATFDSIDAQLDALLSVDSAVLSMESATIAFQAAQAAASVENIAALQTQISSLDAILGGVLSLQQAINEFASATRANTAAVSAQAAAAAAATAAAATAAAAAASGPIEQIYQSVLGRAADDAGLAFYRGVLNSGALSLGGITDNIAASSEGANFAATGVPSFDGGGYTGNGSRTGGLDGQGGFLSMLHPQETVTDHTRGGGSNAELVSEMRALNNRVEQLTAYQKQTTINTGNTSFDLKDIRRNGVQVEPVAGAIFKTDEVA